jgi:hypothetical protein
MCSTCFPRLSLPADASLSSTGSSEASSPASTVLSKRYDFLLPIPPRCVAFAWRYLGFHSLCSLLDGRVRRRGLELVTRYLQPGFAEETTGPPKFLGNLDYPFAHVPIRRRWDCSHQTVHSAAAWPLVIERQRLPRQGLSTLNSMAFGLAVYASPGSLPRHDARLASGCWSGATGRAFHPQGSDERFQICFLHHFLLSQASCRNHIHPCIFDA